MKRFIIIILGCAISLGASAQIPQGYYSPLINKSGTAQILQTLHSLISSHTNVGYDGLYNVYPSSDSDAGGKMWDMYSTCDWTHGQKKCGNYKNVCDCYNREHSVPQSWFNEANPMKSDAFHVYPTDGKVNGQRSNYPYGECSGGTNLGGKALGKLGSSTFTGYTNVGTVFEPVDQYKGDFARSYFYMVACYYDKNFTQATEGTKVFTWSAGKAGFTDYAKALFMKWTRQDTVSAKEHDRNDAIYQFQHNRNPFIDCHGLEEWIWGSKVGQTITQDDLVACGCMEGSTPVEAITFPALTAVNTDDGVRLECLPDGAGISVFDAMGRLQSITSADGPDAHLSLGAGMWLIIVSAQDKQQAIKVLK